MELHKLTPLLLLIVLSAFFGVDGAQVPLCTALDFGIIVSDPASGELAFTYHGNIALAPVDPWHSSFSLTNTTFWSSNYSRFYQNLPLFFDDIESSWLGCPTINGTCNLTIHDGPAFFDLRVLMDGEEVIYGLTSYFHIDQGTIFSDYWDG